MQNTEDRIYNTEYRIPDDVAASPWTTCLFGTQLPLCCLSLSPTASPNLPRRVSLGLLSLQACTCTVLVPPVPVPAGGLPRVHPPPLAAPPTPTTVRPSVETHAAAQISHFAFRTPVVHSSTTLTLPPSQAALCNLQPTTHKAALNQAPGSAPLIWLAATAFQTDIYLLHRFYHPIPSLAPSVHSPASHVCTSPFVHLWRPLSAPLKAQRTSNPFSWPAEHEPPTPRERTTPLDRHHRTVNQPTYANPTRRLRSHLNLCDRHPVIEAVALSPSLP